MKPLLAQSGTSLSIVKTCEAVTVLDAFLQIHPGALNTVTSISKVRVIVLLRPKQRLGLSIIVIDSEPGQGSFRLYQGVRVDDVGFIREQQAPASELWLLRCASYVCDQLAQVLVIGKTFLKLGNRPAHSPEIHSPGSLSELL